MNTTKKVTVVAVLALAFLRLASQHAGAQPAPCYTVPGGVQTLDGTNNYSTLAYTSSMAQPSLTGQLSLSAWVCPNQTDTPQIVFKREGAYQLQVNASDDPRFSFTAWTGNGVRSLISDLCVDTLRWQHIAGTYDGTNWRIYHNGRSVGSLTASDGPPAAGSLPPAAPFSPDANTVLLWHLNENTGTNAVDVAAPVLDGANNGAIMPDTILPDYGWTTGRFGNGMNSPSNGTGYVSTTLGSGLFTNQQITMEAWIKPTAIDSGGSYIMGFDNGSGADPFSFVRLGSGTGGGVGFRVTSGGTQWAEVNPSFGTNVLDGNWHHVAGTFSNGVVRMYLDGVLIGTNSTYAGAPLAGTPGRFVAAGDAPWSFGGTGANYIGDIDEIRLSNMARTSFALGSAFSPDANTVLLWHLDEGSGTTTADAATPVLDGANTGTIVPNYIHGWVTGQFGSGLNSRSNSTGYVSASLGSGLFSTQATMEAWVRPTAIASDAAGASYVMGWKGSSSQNSFIRLYTGSYVGVGFRVTGGGAYWAQADFSLPVNLLDGTWRHIAGTYSNGIVRLFLNGTLVGSANTGYGAGWSLMQPSSFIAAGGPSWDPAGSGGGRYIGDMDEVRLSNIARSDFGATPSPMWVGANIANGVPQMFFGGNLSDLKVYDVALTSNQVATLAATPPATLPPPVGSTTVTQAVNSTAIVLEVGNGLRLNQMGGTISSGGGRLFVININGSPISSDRVTARQAEMTTLNGGWQIPFNLPSGQGAGVLEFLPGSATGFVQAKLSLTNSGPSAEWQVAFPHLEGMSLNGLAPANVEFFFPFQDGWLSRGQHDIKGDYGHVASLPILAAWHTNGPGIAIQSRDTNFPYRILRYRNAAMDTSPTGYYPNYDGVETKFRITKPGATLGSYSLPFTLGTNETWNAPATVVQVFAGTNRFKDVLSSYGQWARANWWTHRAVPAELRDRFISVSLWENNGGRWFGGLAENYQDNYRAHSVSDWAYWWDHDESIVCSNNQPYMLTHGNYWFESNWGGAPAYAADVVRCRNAGMSTILYLQARIVWKQSQVGLAHKTDWGWMDSPGHYNEDWTGTDFGYGCIGDLWSMCPQAAGWHQYLANACQLAVQGSGADGVRLDTAAQYLVCYNTNHPHSDTMERVCAFMQTVRNALDAAGTCKWLMVEHFGSDAMARYFDASLGQAHDAGSPNASLIPDAYGLVPFRFVYPEVKLFEWGDMWSDTNYHQASRRMLFNGVGTTRGCKASYYPELFHFSEVLRSMGDVLASPDCEPLVPTMVSGVLANRFSLNGREVYTLWNQSGAPVSGQVFRITGASGRRFMNLVTGRAVSTVRSGSDDIVSLSIPNDEVVMIGVFPQKLIQSAPGNLAQTFSVQSGLPVSLQAVDAITDEVLVSGGTAITVADSLLVGRTVVVRAVSNGYLVQDCLEASPGMRNEFAPDASTVVLWHFNEGSGTTALDAATPTLDGANNGTITANTIWTTGRFGAGLNAVAGDSGYVSTTLGSGLFTNQQITMEAWIKPTAIDSGGSYIMGFDNGSGADPFSFVRLGSGTGGGVGFKVTSGGTQWAQVNPSFGTNVLDGNWHHVAGTFSNGVVRMYLDGVLIGINSAYAGAPLAGTPGRFVVAGDAPWNIGGTGANYIGAIDEVRLSRTARTDFTAPPAPVPPSAEFWPDARTVLLWHLNESSGSGVSDVATPVLDGANTGTIVANNTRTAGKFGGGVNSLSNGTGYVSASLGTSLFTTQAAMDAWIRPTSVASGGSYVMGWKGSGTEYSFIRLYSGTSVGVGFRVTGAGAYWAQADFNLPVNLLNNWNHIAGTFSNGVVRCYLNGALMGSYDTGYGAGWTLMQPNTFVAAGGAAWDPTGTGGGRYIGDMDEIRLSNVARTDFTAAPGPAAPSAEYAPDDRTVALWHLNEGSGSTAADTATPVLDGANDATIIPNDTWTTGRFGSGLNAATNGTGYLSAPLGPGLFTTRATMDAWIRPTAIATGGAYVMGYKGTNAGYSFVRLYQGGTAVGVGFQVTDGGSVYFAQADFNLPVNLLDGTWRHIAGTFSDGIVRMYLNGVLMGSYDTGYGDGWTLSQPNAFIAAGAAAWDPSGSQGGRFIGDLDEVRLSNVARADFSTAAVTPTVSIAVLDTNMVIHYAGVLQSATVVTGPFTDVAGATSPYTNSPTAAQRYFRSRVP